jgi:PAS domain S-box-containing protein
MKNQEPTKKQLVEQIRSLQEKIDMLAKTAAVPHRTQDAPGAFDENLSTILEKNADGIVIVDTDGIVLYVNPAAEKLFGRRKEEFLGYPFGHPVSADKAEDSLVIGQGDHLREVELRMVQVQWQKRLAFQLSIRDISDRRQKEKNLRKLIRTLQAKSKSSQAMMHATDERSYLAEVCRIISKDCDHALVWIGYAENDEKKTVRPVAYCGFEEGSIESMETTWADTERGWGPVGTAIRTGMPSLFRDILTDATYAPWRDAALKRGYASVISIPLLENGKAFGSLNIYSREQDRFSDDEVKLLSDLAADLSYGIAAIRLRTTQAEAETALRESERRFHSLFDNMLEGLAYCRMVFENDVPVDFIYLVVNGAFEKLTGLKNVVGKKVSEVIPGIREALPELFTIYGRVASTGRPERFETYFETFGGWLAVSAYSTEKGYFVAVFDNITERKRAEEKNIESQNILRSIVENVPLRVFWKDAELRYLGCNAAFARDAGMSHPEDLIGKDDSQMAWRDRAERYRADDKLVMDNDTQKLGYEEPQTTTEGHTLWLRTSKVPLHDFDGKVTGILGIYEDITARKQAEEEHHRLEEQLRHAQKMEAIGQLAGGVAHDFNNILNVIMGYGGLILDKIGPDSPLREQMNEVLAAAERASTLTKRLLIFSRKQVVDTRAVNVNEIISGIQKMLSRVIGEDIDLQINLADKRLTVMADSAQIEHVLMNLVTNARDAMPQGGHLTITTETAQMDDAYVAAYGYGKPGEYAVIAVADTGRGIDTETQKKIFEPFFTTKGIGEGTGLGLAISYGIVKLHNGYIKCYSETGKGTVFKIYLPLIEDSAASRIKAESPGAVKGGTETILVAEDDLSLRKLARIVLESFGYSTIMAENGEDAVARFVENRDKIKLVILDLVMPKKSGKEAYQEIKKMSPGIRAFFVSGYTMDMISRMELEKGMEIIRKPFIPIDLLRKVREVLDR